MSMASVLGPVLTFGEIILSAVVGGVILKNFRHALSGNMFVLMQGGITQEQFIKNNIYMAVGALLLIIPGFLTDMIGALMQFSAVASPLFGLFYRKGKHPTTRSEYQNQTPHSPNNHQNEEIIDVEIIDDHSNRR